MLSGNDYACSTSEISPVPTDRLPRITANDQLWTAAVPSVGRTMLDVWLPQRREHERRLQQTIDGVESQIVLLDSRGEVAAVNRVWRMTATMQGLSSQHYGIGTNYLALCRHAAEDGCRDATATAEGIEAVMEGRWRSFSYKYDWTAAGERRLYALLAWRVVEDGLTYVAVMHELIETQIVAADVATPSPDWRNHDMAG
jgi:hypothetical protein